MTIEIIIDGERKIITKEQLFGLAAQARIGPNTQIVVNGKIKTADQVKGIIFKWGPPKAGQTTDLPPATEKIKRSHKPVVAICILVPLLLIGGIVFELCRTKNTVAGRKTTGNVTQKSEDEANTIVEYPSIATTPTVASIDHLPDVPFQVEAPSETLQVSGIASLRREAEQGNAIAQNNLGICYFEGEGIAEDHQEAVKWFRKAAEQEVALSQKYLGTCYLEGLGVAKDRREAVNWFRKAAEQGDEESQLFLGMSYTMGEGVDKDLNLNFCNIAFSSEKTRFKHS